MSKQSSTLGAAINLSKVSIGAGILALPNSISRGGLLFAPIVIAVIALWNGIACSQMIECKHACKNVAFPADLSSTYSKIAYAGCGRLGVLITDFSIIITLLGVCVTYIIAFSALLGDLPVAAFNPFSLSIVFAVGIYPISCAKNVGKFAVLSMVGLVCLGASVVAILLYGWMFYGDAVIKHPLESLSNPEQKLPLWPETLADVTSFVGVATFCFGLTLLVFPIEESMEHRHEFHKAVAWSLVFIWFVYMVLGEGGAILYIHAPLGIRGNILSNLPADSPTAVVVRCAMALTCWMTYPLVLVPPAHMIEHMLLKYFPESLHRTHPNPLHYHVIKSSDPDCQQRSRVDPSVSAGGVGGGAGGGGGGDTPSYGSVELGAQADDLSVESVEGIARDADAVKARREGLTADVPLSLRMLCRGLLIALTTAFAVFVPCFGVVISLLGAFTVAILSFIMPHYLHMMIIGSKKTLALLPKLSEAEAPVMTSATEPSSISTVETGSCSGSGCSSGSGSGGCIFGTSKNEAAAECTMQFYGDAGLTVGGLLLSIVATSVVVSDFITKLQAGEACI